MSNTGFFTDQLPEGLQAADIEAILRGHHHDPFAVLGPHDGQLRVFAPNAAEVSVVTKRSRKPLTRLHGEGFFCGPAPKDAYRLEMQAGDHKWEIEDPYRFSPVLGEMDEHLLAEGSHRRLYDKLGAHPVTHEGVSGVAFALWAPNARRVSVVGHFNAWDGRRHPMRKRHGPGMWELFIPGLAAGEIYKYEIVSAYGERLPLKADPVGFAHEQTPETASVIHGLPEHDWNDQPWMSSRATLQDRHAPISVYEVHLGSWRRSGEGDMLDYDTIGDLLLPYLEQMAFTHVEFLPVTEHPFTGSWGYQPIGLFAPTSRFGSPEAFARLVDRLHQAGIGVILDWVPAHFPSDAHGLARFDGTALYEHEDPRQGFHQDWNTLIYNFGRREVANFLQASALYWLERFHVDALRVDAVASMLYLDYSRQPGEWVPNRHGGNQNLEAISFLQDVNERVSADYPGAITIAEESTAFPKVSRPVDDGGLGFAFKWNMGWMHDTLTYFRRDPIHRRHHQHDLTFGLDYAFSEDFVLPLSHDEVVHGKGSLIRQMAGDRWQKFANLRAYFGFMWTHPGKKLLFMGCEFAQEKEWNHDQSLDWHLLDDSMHQGVQTLVGDLNRLYREHSALHRLDCEPAGFEWIDASNAAQSVLVYMRKSDDGAPPVVVICNLAPVVHEDYRIGVPLPGSWREALNTDAARYGGSDAGNPASLEAEATPMHGRDHSLRLTLPPLATIVMIPA